MFGEHGIKLKKSIDIEGILCKSQSQVQKIPQTRINISQSLLILVFIFAIFVYERLLAQYLFSPDFIEI